MSRADPKKKMKGKERRESNEGEGRITAGREGMSPVWNSESLNRMKENRTYRKLRSWNLHRIMKRIILHSTTTVGNKEKCEKWGFFEWWNERDYKCVCGGGGVHIRELLL